MLIFRNSVIGIFCFLFFLNGKAQKSSDFFSSADMGVEELYQNPDVCISFIQSLLISEGNAERRIILQHILAEAYIKKGDYAQSIKASLDNEIQKFSGDDFSDFHFRYSLAEQYQNLKLFHQSDRILREIKTLNYQSLNGLHSGIYKIKTRQLDAYNQIFIGKRDDALKIFSEINSSLPENTNTFESFAIKAETRIFSASVYLNKGDKEKAAGILDLVMKDLSQHPDAAFLYAYTIERKAQLDFLNNNYKEAISNLENALKKIEKSGYLPLEERLYEGLSKNYLAENKENEYQKYNKLYINTKTKLDNNRKEGIRYILKLTESFDSEDLLINEKREKKISLSVLAGSMVFILALLGYLLYERNETANLKKRIEFFRKQQSGEFSGISAESEEENDSQPVSTKNPRKKISISKEKELEIIEKLKDWEQSNHFLNKEMSLATLAVQVDINTKYLSEIINGYKGKNFNYYINELRVNYIANLLKNDSAYLNYKVSYLAEISGFYSHSTFATVFKNITGMSPNVYIQQISNTRK